MSKCHSKTNFFFQVCFSDIAGNHRNLMQRQIKIFYNYKSWITPLKDLTVVATHKYSRFHSFVSKLFASNHIPRGCLGDYSYRRTADNNDVM